MDILYNYNFIFTTEQKMIIILEENTLFFKFRIIQNT